MLRFLKMDFEEAHHAVGRVFDVAAVQMTHPSTILDVHCHL